MRGNPGLEFIVLDFGTKRPRVSEPNVAPVGRRRRRREANGIESRPQAQWSQLHTVELAP